LLVVVKEDDTGEQKRGGIKKIDRWGMVW